MGTTTLPLGVILIIFAVLFGFFRHLVMKVVAILLIELALFVLFPDLLVQLARLVTVVRQAIS